MSIQARNASGQVVTIATIDDLLALVATAAGQVQANTLLTAIGGSVDGVEAGLAAILAKLISSPATAQGQTDIVAALTTLGTYLDGLEGYTDGIEALLTQLKTQIVLAAGSAVVGKVGLQVAGADVSAANPAQITTPGAATVPAGFTSPAGAKAYVSGDLIADSTSAATVNANTTAGAAGIMIFAVARAADKTGMVRRARIKTTDTAFANKTVRLHLYKSRPTVSNGDDGVWLTTESTYVGSIDVLLDRTFTDFVKGIGVPNVGSEINFEPFTGTPNLFGVLECRDTVTGGASKVWDVTLEVLRD